MKLRDRGTVALLLILGLTLSLSVACHDEEGPAEELGESLDEAIEDLKDTGDDLGDRLEDARDTLKEGVEDAKDNVKEGVEDAKDALDDDGNG